MHVNVTAQVLSLGTQYRGHAQFATEVSGMTPKLVGNTPGRLGQAAV